MMRPGQAPDTVSQRNIRCVAAVNDGGSDLLIHWCVQPHLQLVTSFCDNIRILCSPDRVLENIVELITRELAERKEALKA